MAHWKALGDEYTRRYGKVHKSLADHWNALSEPPEAIPDGPLTTFPQCMPDECKRSDPMQGYHVYYNYKADAWDATGKPMKWYGQEAV